MTVPTRLWLCLTVSTGLLLLAAVSTAIFVDRRDESIDAISDRTQRVEAAWDVHRELATAASAGADSFLSLSGSPDGGFQADQDFDTAMRNAANAMTRATDPADAPAPAPPVTDAAGEKADEKGCAAAPPTGAGAADGDAHDTTAQLTTLACLTPQYSGLVGEARAHSRTGDSVGAAYLRRAATLMHSDLLPASNRLTHEHAARLSADYRQATKAADVWIVSGTGLVAIAVLLGIQVFLVGWTNRWLCLPLVAATLLAVAGLSWTLVAFNQERDHLETAYAEGYALRSQLAYTRQLALRGEGDVLYWRIAQGGSVAFNDDYDRVAEQLQTLSATLGVDIATQVRSAVEGGERALTTGVCNAAPDGSAYTRCNGSADAQATPDHLRDDFDRLETTIGAADRDAAKNIDAAFDRAAGWLDGLAGAAAALFGVAALLAAAGIAPRLWEYR